MINKRILKYLKVLVFAAITAAVPIRAAAELDEQVSIGASADVAEMELTSFKLFHDGDSRFWQAWDGFEAGTEPDNVEWGNFHGRNSLKVEWDDVWSGFIRTDWVFLEEDWSDYDGLKAYIYIDPDNDDEPRVHLETKEGEFEELENITADPMPVEEWFSHTWEFDSGIDYEQVTALAFHFDSMGNSNASVFISSLTLVSAEEEVLWDSMYNPNSVKWVYEGDVVNFSSDPNEPVTHTLASSTSPAGSVRMEWDYSQGESGEAKVEASGFLIDLSTITHITANIQSDSTEAPLKIALYDGEGFHISNSLTPETAGTWQNLKFDISGSLNFDRESVEMIIFILETDGEDSTGTVYIDDIYLAHP